MPQTFLPQYGHLPFSMRIFISCSPNSLSTLSCILRICATRNPVPAKTSSPSSGFPESETSKSFQHRKKARFWMLWTLSGIVTLVNSVQSAKAYCWISTTDRGIATVTTAVPENARLPIRQTPSGMIGYKSLPVYFTNVPPRISNSGSDAPHPLSVADSMANRLPQYGHTAIPPVRSNGAPQF